MHYVVSCTIFLKLIFFFGVVKRKLAENEIVSDLIAADVSNKLKLALLHDTEANRLTKRVDSVVNFYGWDGKKIIGPYPEKSNNCLQNFT